MVNSEVDEASVKFTMLDILLILVEGQINSEFLTLVGLAF
jgi:hypothetical protein